MCLLGNGFFSGSEIAIISARRSRIEAAHRRGQPGGALRVKRLQDNMDRFLATVQIGVTLMGTLAGVLGGYLASRTSSRSLDGGRRALVRAAAVGGDRRSSAAGIVYVELILGELVPKALALRFTDTRRARWWPGRC